MCLSCLFICPSKWSEFSIWLSLEFSIWFYSRLQPWLHRRRNWREWAPQKRDGRTRCQTSQLLLAGNSFCVPRYPAPPRTPERCLSACTVFSPKRISDWPVPFHQIPPSSNSSRVTSLMTSETVLTPSVGGRLSPRGHEQGLSSWMIKHHTSIWKTLTPSLSCVVSWWEQREWAWVTERFLPQRGGPCSGWGWGPKNGRNSLYSLWRDYARLFFSVTIP